MGHDVIRDFREARRLLGVVPQELVFDPFFQCAGDPAHPVRIFRHPQER